MGCIFSHQNTLNDDFPQVITYQATTNISPITIPVSQSSDIRENKNMNPGDSLAPKSEGNTKKPIVEPQATSQVKKILSEEPRKQHLDGWEDLDEREVQCSNEQLYHYVIERQRRPSAQEILTNLSSYQFPSPTIVQQPNNFEFVEQAQNVEFDAKSPSNDASWPYANNMEEGGMQKFEREVRRMSLTEQAVLS